MSATNTTDDSTDTYTPAYYCSPDLNEYTFDDDAPEALDEMFEALRRQQIVTVMGDACCRGCANSAAGSHADDLEGEGREVTGTATFSEQDLNENWDHDYEEGFVTYDTEAIWVSYSGRDVPDAAVAGLIQAAAHDAGLETEWDGDTGTCVKVYL